MLYDLFVVCFVQLVLAFALFLSPLHRLGSRWKASRFNQIVLSGLAVGAISAVSCIISSALWGLTADPMEAAAIILTVASVIVIVVRPAWTFAGQFFLATYVSGAITFIVYAIDISAGANASPFEALVAALVIALELAAVYIWVGYVSETCDVMCRKGPSLPRPLPDPDYLPMVSLHIPAYDEPPEMLIATIASAERIDYPDFEIVVVDNNTTDPSVYRPVEEYCRNRERVRFVHVAPWPGYKPGALNLALRSHTDPRAELIGLIDSDDIVESHYLRETAPYFCDQRLGFLQTFEGNRDYEGSSYFTACVDGFQSFYLGNMAARNERNSIPCVGTMGLLRRSALDEIGGWDENCICEDTEASLRLLKSGWSGLYIPRCFGRGVVAPSFDGLRKQRYRWCFGAMQIFRSHWRSLMPWNNSPDNHLTLAQRLDYLGACLRWINDLLCFVFALLLLTITGLLLSHSGFALLPLSGNRSLLPIALLVFAVVSLIWSLRDWTSLTFRGSIYAVAIALAQSRMVARACVLGMTSSHGVFLRTPKVVAGRHRLSTALWCTRWETLLAAALYVSAALLIGLAHPPWFLIVVMLIVATVYACAPTVSWLNQRAQLVSARTRLERHERVLLRKARERPALRTAGSAALAIGTLGGGVVAAAFLAPNGFLHSSTPSGFLHSTTHQDGPPPIRAVGETHLFVQLGGDTPGDTPTSYPVISAELSPATTTTTPSAPSPRARFSLRIETSSIPLLELLQQDYAGDARVGPLTLVAQSVPAQGQPVVAGPTELFATTVVTSFSETFAAVPVGVVTLAVSGTGEQTTAQK